MELRTDDGVRLDARRWQAEGTARSAVVLVHGFTGSKDQPEVSEVAAGLATAGFDVIAYDARGHHRSDGLCTLGDREQLDVAAAVDEARRHADRVVTVGASMGGIAVLRHAATDSRLDGVVTVSAPARWRLSFNPKTLLATALTRSGPGRWFAARNLGVRIDPRWTNPPPPEALASDIRAPLAVIHGTEDRMIPLGESHRLRRSAIGPARLDIVRGMGHAFEPLAVPVVVDAVRWTLEHQPAAGH
jgi:pimeloyl-ACP methyl ester carboxylesterase